MTADLLLMCILLTVGSGDDRTTTENKYVHVGITLGDSTVAAVGKGSILITFNPADGIHVNADPPVEVAIEPNDVVTLDGDPDVTTDKETGFLSTSSPVIQRFLVSGSAAPGHYSLKGTIVYYFCSDTQGWCTKFKQPVTLTLVVAKR